MEPAQATHAGVSDHDLLVRFFAGERQALGDLAHRHERGLLGLAKGIMGGDEQAACDAVQAMWVRVIRYGRGFKGTSEVKTWLYRILINECRDARRRGAAHAGMSVAGEPTLRLVNDGGNANGDAAGLHAALESLPEERREVLLTCYHAGMTHTVAAEVLEIPLGTLKSRLSAALKELREALGAGTEDGEVVA